MKTAFFAVCAMSLLAQSVREIVVQSTKRRETPSHLIGSAAATEGLRGVGKVTPCPLQLRWRSPSSQVSWVAIADKPQVGFVNQPRRLNGLPGLLARHVSGREHAQFGVNERQQFGGGLRVARLDRIQNLSHVAHRCLVYLIARDD